MFKNSSGDIDLDIYHRIIHGIAILFVGIFISSIVSGCSNQFVHVGSDGVKLGIIEETIHRYPDGNVVYNSKIKGFSWTW